MNYYLIFVIQRTKMFYVDIAFDLCRNEIKNSFWSNLKRVSFVVCSCRPLKWSISLYLCKRRWRNSCVVFLFLRYHGRIIKHPFSAYLAWRELHYVAHLSSSFLWVFCHSCGMFQEMCISVKGFGGKKNRPGDCYTRVPLILNLEWVSYVLHVTFSYDAHDW